MRRRGGRRDGGLHGYLEVLNEGRGRQKRMGFDLSQPAWAAAGEGDALAVRPFLEQYWWSS